MEESDEQLSGDQSENDDEDHWDPNRGELVGILSSVFEDQEAWASVKSTDSKHTDEDEEACQDVCEVELDEMFQVENETIPGTLAVWVTRDGHESIGPRVQFLNQTLKARDKTFKEAANTHSDSTSTSSALRSVNNAVNDNSDHDNNGVEKGSKGDGTRMLEVSNGHTWNDACRSSLISVGREVELSSSDHIDKLSLFTDETKDPDDAENHSNSHESCFGGKSNDLVILVGIGIMSNRDFTHRNNTNQAKAPNEDQEDTYEEVVNGNNGNSFRGNHKVSSRVNYCNGNL